MRASTFYTHGTYLLYILTERLLLFFTLHNVLRAHVISRQSASRALRPICFIFWIFGVR